ncbi:hypothetical protein ATEIFO6365_0006025500 [Aspergillus terreus]|uniref:Uncharacterized protein n=1 Tax=Aspergillus terreus TaxID=33178 RepID=A0A5M3Z078_ASPTE|nr:hypothetical protein ATETN484_0005025300 [Aspergillus terreus]GFF16918.1 hypothetical protein ATEIFO6365_0006025500 [Aspergillus terreus]
MKLHLPIAVLALVASGLALDSSASSSATDKDKDHEHKQKNEPKEKYCKIDAHGDASVYCQTEPGLMGYVLATVREGASYELGCYKEIGNCLYNHCEWYKLAWEGQSCYVNGYYTECDKEKHVKC